MYDDVFGEVGDECRDDFDRSFLDGAALDLAAVQPILEPYPELWAEWQRRVRLAPAEMPWPYDQRLCYSPTLMRAVVRQHEHLRSDRDKVPFGLDEECDALAATCPGLAEERRAELTDPWLRAGCLIRGDADELANWYDLDYIRRAIELRNRPPDPNSTEFRASSLKIKQFIDEADAATRPEGGAKFN